MRGITIDVFPACGELSESFKRALIGARRRHLPRVTHKGVTLHLQYGAGGKLSGVRVILNSLDDPLPRAFRTGEIRVNFVRVNSPVPKKLRPRPGWYYGPDFGFTEAECLIDPEGVLSSGRPTVFASGGSFSDVVGFFKYVMAGRVAPSREGSSRVGAGSPRPH